MPVSQAFYEHVLVRKMNRNTVAKQESEKVLPVPRNYDTAPMIHADLEDAQEVWILQGSSDDERANRYESNFPRESTTVGRVDFHSLRHTFGTALAKAGVAPKIAMDLMRHSDINLTMRLYSHTAVADRAEAHATVPTPDTSAWEHCRENTAALIANRSNECEIHPTQKGHAHDFVFPLCFPQNDGQTWIPGDCGGLNCETCYAS